MGNKKIQTLPITTTFEEAFEFFKSHHAVKIEGFGTFDVVIVFGGKAAVKYMCSKEMYAELTKARHKPVN